MPRSLTDILAEAAKRPELPNTTVLNQTHFVTIRAPRRSEFRQRLDALAVKPLAEGQSLVEVQRTNADEGLIVIRPVFGGLPVARWYLRALSSLGEDFPAGRGQFASLAEALDGAIRWWEADQDHRGVTVDKDIVDGEISADKIVAHSIQQARQGAA